MSMLGCIDVKVRSQKQEAQLPLVVMKGNGPTLLGQNSWPSEAGRRGWLEPPHFFSKSDL